MRPALAVTALLLALAGCSSGAESEPEGDGASEPAGAPAGTAPASPAVAAADPIAVEGYDTDRTCFGSTGRYLLWEVVEVTRPVTLESIEMSAPVDTGVIRSWVTPQPAGEVEETGSARGMGPVVRNAERLGWDQRQPLEGAELEPGRYYWFVQFDVGETGGYDGWEIGWSEDGGAGTTVVPDRTRIQQQPCT